MVGARGVNRVQVDAVVQREGMSTEPMTCPPHSNCPAGLLQYAEEGPRICQSVFVRDTEAVSRLDSLDSDLWGSPLMGLDIPLHVTDRSGIEDLDLSTLYAGAHIQEGLLGSPPGAPWEPREDTALAAGAQSTFFGESPAAAARAASDAGHKVASRSSAPAAIENPTDVAGPSASVVSTRHAPEGPAQGGSSSSHVVPSVGAKRRGQELKDAQEGASWDDRSSEVRRFFCAVCFVLGFVLSFGTLPCMVEGALSRLVPSIQCAFARLPCFCSLARYQDAQQCAVSVRL